MFSAVTTLGMCAYDCASKRLGGGIGEHQAQTTRGEGSVIYRSSSRVSLPDPDLQLASISSAPSELVAGTDGGGGQHCPLLRLKSICGLLRLANF